MASELARQKFVENVLSTVAVLPETKRVDAMMVCLSSLLDSMDANAIREKRDQLMERFSHCGASFETCELVTKWLDCQLALRRAVGGGAEKSRDRR